MFQNGDKVTQIVQSPITGTVCGYGLDQQTGAVSVNVAFTDSDGSEHTRYFQVTELQAAEPTITAPTDAPVESFSNVSAPV